MLTATPPDASNSAAVTGDSTDESAAQPQSGAPEPSSFEVQYVIVGAGTAAHAALRAIVTAEPEAQVLVVGGEAERPYMRTPLSKELWFSTEPDVADTLRFKDFSGRVNDVYYAPVETSCTPGELAEREQGVGGVAVLLGHAAVHLDVRNKTITLDDSRTIKYGKCLLATGATPRTIPALRDAPAPVLEHVTLFRTIADFRRLDAIARSAKHIVVVGGSFLGSELSYALVHRGSDSGLSVTQVFPEDGAFLFLAGLKQRLCARLCAARCAEPHRRWSLLHSVLSLVPLWLRSFQCHSVSVC